MKKRTNNKFLKVALSYCRKLNWSIIPCNGKTASILWSKYEKEIPTEKELDSWWSQVPNANLAVVVGKHSGIIAVDVDDVEYFHSKGFEMPHTPKALSGGGGEHYILKYPDEDDKRIQNYKDGITENGKFKERFSIRCKNQYLILPDSIHPDTGKPYEWVDGQDPFSIPVADPPKWIWDLVLIDPKEEIIKKYTYANHRDAFKEFIRELKARINLTDLLLELGYEGKRQGHYSRFTCPFHDDGKNPDFAVWDDICGAHDYHDDKGYDLISLLMKLKGWDFMETLKFLADRAGLDIPIAKEQEDLPARIEMMILEADENDPTNIEPILSEIEKLPLDTLKEYYKEKLSKKFNIGKRALDKDLRKLRKTLDEDRGQKKEGMVRDELTTLHPSLDIVPEIAVLGFKVPVIKPDREGKERITTEQRVLISDGTENVRVTSDNHFEVGDIDKKTYWLKSVDSPLPLLSDVWSVDEAHGKPIFPNGIFDEIRELAKKYLDLVEEAIYDLLAAWIIATYFNRVFNAFSFLFFFGPKDSGKSTALELVVFTAFNGVKVKTISVASLGDIADGLRGTIGIDQAEALYDPQNLELVGILADSYRKEGGKRRVVLIGKGIRRVLEFDTYCPKVFASQKDLHRDLKDRCIKMPMLRSDKELPELQPWSEPWKKIRGKMYQLFLLRWKDVFNLSHKEYSYKGRLKELWKPVKVIMELLAVPQERQNAVQTLFVKLAEGVQEKLSLWEELMFEILLNKGQREKEDTFTVTSVELLSELRYVLGAEPEQLTEQWVGFFVSRFQLSVSAPKRRKIAGKLKTEYTLSKERIKNVFGRYAEKPDTPDTRDKKDNDSEEMDGIGFKTDASDTARHPDAEDEDKGIAVSDGIRRDRIQPDTEKSESLQENTDSGITVSQGSGGLAKEKIPLQSEAEPRQKNEEGAKGDTSQQNNTEDNADNKSSITETLVCTEGFYSWEDEVEEFLSKTGGS